MSRLAEVAARDGRACLWCGREPWAADATLEHARRLAASSRRSHREYGRRQLRHLAHR